MSDIRVRFAPSPTGALHIGGARTALFNFLYAKHGGGKFLLRIEDTDRERSTEQSARTMIEGLTWLGIVSDEPIVFQSANMARHQAVARKLVERGAAYYCYTTAEELEQERDKHHGSSKAILSNTSSTRGEVSSLPNHPPKFRSKWRDAEQLGLTPPPGVQPTIRLRMPTEGTTVIDDLIQGRVSVDNSQLDDMVLLRSDGTPTYMLAAVVDDHDMGITHIIRADEHLNNAFRQLQLFKAMNWTPPIFSHIALIHGKDGGKLSKRHGAVGLNYYEAQGYLPEAINNYLLRLGWGHGNDEIISMQQAIEWFDIKDVKKSPARLDFDKMLHLNAHYIKAKPDAELVELMHSKFEEIAALPADKLELLTRGIGAVKTRAKTLNELLDQSRFYIAEEPIHLSEEALAIVQAFDPALLAQLCETLNRIHEWNEPTIKAAIHQFMTNSNLTMECVGHLLRALLAGSLTSPSVFGVMHVLGQEKVLRRLKR